MVLIPSKHILPLKYDNVKFVVACTYFNLNVEKIKLCIVYIYIVAVIVNQLKF